MGSIQKSGKSADVLNIKGKKVSRVINRNNKKVLTFYKHYQKSGSATGGSFGSTARFWVLSKSNKGYAEFDAQGSHTLTAADLHKLFGVEVKDIISATVSISHTPHMTGAYTFTYNFDFRYMGAEITGDFGASVSDTTKGNSHITSSISSDYSTFTAQETNLKIRFYVKDKVRYAVVGGNSGIVHKTFNPSTQGVQSGGYEISLNQTEFHELFHDVTIVTFNGASINYKTYGAQSEHIEIWIEYDLIVTDNSPYPSSENIVWGIT